MIFPVRGRKLKNIGEKQKKISRKSFGPLFSRAGAEVQTLAYWELPSYPAHMHQIINRKEMINISSRPYT